jgi:hypothetical protein
VKADEDTDSLYWCVELRLEVRVLVLVRFMEWVMVLVKVNVNFMDNGIVMVIFMAIL